MNERTHKQERYNWTLSPFVLDISTSTGAATPLDVQFESSREKSPVEETSRLRDRCNGTQRRSRRELFRRHETVSHRPSVERSDGILPLIRRSHGKEDPLQLRLQTSSPHIELLRQQYAYLLANATNKEHRLYPQPSPCECLLAQKALAQQFLDGYRSLMDHQALSQSTIEGKQCVPSRSDLHTESFFTDRAQPSDLTIDEHFRKSLGNTYDRLATGFLTPDYASSNSSPTERTPGTNRSASFSPFSSSFDS